MTALLRLSWPDKALSKNAKNKWSVGFQKGRSRQVAKQRKEAWALALEQGAKRITSLRPVLTFTYYPPDRRHRDLHNMQEMLAGAIDGIQDAIGRDDRFFDIRWPDRFEEPVKGGCVLIEIEGDGDE